MKLFRRQFLHLAAGAAAPLAISRIAWAQTYPTRLVTIVVPFAPGGTTDVSARIVAEHMSRTLGQQFIIENVPGAGGTTGSARAMRAVADGYTIMMGQVGTHAFSVALYPNLAYRPDVDFAPIGLVLDSPLLIVARKDFPPKDLRDFAAYIRANGDKLNVAHAGVGSITYTFALYLNSVLGVKPTMVPFNGAAPAANALIAGHVDYRCNLIAEIGQQVQAGTVKAYGISGARRHPVLPEVLSAEEAGMPEFQATAWFALFAPKGVPQGVLDRLSDALDRALDDNNVRRRLRDIGGDDLPKVKRGQQPLAALVKSEIARWAPIIKSANVRPE